MTLAESKITILERDIPEVDMSVESVRKMLKDGVEAKVIAERLGLDVKVVKQITMTAKTTGNVPSLRLAEESAPRQILTYQLANALDAVDIAREAYEDKPSGGNATALAILIETIQNLLKDIKSNETPEQLIKELDQKVMQPMVIEMIKHLTNEMHKARNEILKYVDLSKQGIVMEIIKQGLSGFGQHAKLAYENSLETLKAEVAGGAGKKRS